MITDREYPATHSMSTSWFGIDKDGHVALLEFDDDGPAPNMAEQTGPEYLITEKLTSLDPDGIPNLNLTVEQARELEKIMTEPDASKLDSGMLVKIDKSREAEFTAICIANHYDEDYDEKTPPYVRFCTEEGLYYVEMYEYDNQWSDETKERLVSEGIVLKQFYYSIFPTDRWNAEEKKTEFDPTEFVNFPFYLYQETYGVDEPMGRTVVPDHPFMEHQMDDAVRGRALRFPFSFDDMPRMRIAEFAPCYSYANTISEREGNFEVDKDILPLSDGSIAAVRKISVGHICCDTCNRCPAPEGKKRLPLYSLQTGLHPTVVILMSHKEAYHGGYYIRYDFAKIFPAILNRLYALPLAGGVWNDKTVDSRKIEYADLESLDLTPEAENCREHVEEAIRLLAPRVILATESARPYVDRIYSPQGGTLRIAGEEYPYYPLPLSAEDMAAVKELAALPYRGVTPPWTTPASPDGIKNCHYL